MPPAIRRAIRDTGENFLLRLLAEAVELRDAPVVARLREPGDVRDPEFVAQYPDFFRAEPGNLQHFHQTGLDRRLEFFEKLQPARGVKLGDFSARALRRNPSRFSIRPL